MSQSPNGFRKEVFLGKDQIQDTDNVLLINGAIKGMQDFLGKHELSHREDDSAVILTFPSGVSVEVNKKETEK